VKKQPPRLFVRYRPKPVKSPKVGTPRIVRVAPAPRPARKPAEEIIETSPTLIVINLGTKEEQSLAADVRTVSSPQNVQRPRLTAELVSTDAGWGSTDSTDGG
jgi:outer membrane biosynthesis protein TonB